MNGKDKCEIFRNIRKNVAERYGLEYHPRECHHKGNCPGTCPMCDAEVRDLQRQLDEKGITEVDVSDKSVQDMFQHYVNVAGQLHPMDDDGQPLQLQGDVMPPDDQEPEILAGIPAPPDDEQILEGMPMPPEHFHSLEDERTIIETYIAGIKFHDALEVWEDLYEGMHLLLVRDKDNRYDDNAVAIETFIEKDGKQERYMLGFIPREQNETIAALIDMGWSDLVSAIIDEIDDHNGKRLEITITISIRNKNNVNIVTEDNGMRYITMDSEEYAETLKEIETKGTTYFRWGGFPTWEHDLPDEGENVLVVCQGDETTTFHVLMVVALGNGCIPFVEGGIDEIIRVDDCIAYILVSLNRVATFSNDEVSDIIDEIEECWQPELRLSVKSTEKINRLVVKSE